jgi:predicted RNA binding protein YcfA (HicA-like mRNA interferase family)
MPRLGPVSRNDLIRYMRQLGFDGPHPGRRHSFMRLGALAVRIPNPHRGDISEPLLREILRQAGITRSQWEAL